MKRLSYLPIEFLVYILADKMLLFLGIKVESVEEFVVKSKVPKKGKRRKNDMENG